MAKAIRKKKKGQPDNEAFNSMLREFHRKVNEEDILQTARRRMYFKKPSEEKRDYKNNLRRRWMKRKRREERFNHE